MGTHQSLQSARDTAEKEKRGGDADGVAELLNWEKWKKMERKRRKGKRRGRWGVPTLDGAYGGEHEVSASLVVPIYRPTRLVS